MKKDTQIDPITGGPSETALRMQLEKMRSQLARSYSVVTMDLQDFSQIATTFGHDEGKQVLIHLSHTLQNCLAKDEPEGRISGDTFYFVVKNRVHDELWARLARINEEANAFNHGSKDPYRLHLRFGAYIGYDANEPLVSMVAKANKARSFVDDGVICHIFDASKDDIKVSEHKDETIAKIDRGLENKEFVVYLCPNIRLSDYRIVGAEAMVRWKTAEEGVLGPESFMSVMEDYHITGRLTRYVLEEVCSTLNRWREEGRELCPISISLSLSDLDQNNVAECYDEICRRYQISPKLIMFDLSTDIFHDHVYSSCNAIRELHSRGFRCALSHFGSQLLPASVFRQIELDVIKLENKFFNGESDSSASRHVLEAILHLAAQLRVSTVAQGIENMNQVRYLKKSACGFAQGYFFFGPVTIKEFEEKAYTQKTLRYLELEEKEDLPIYGHTIDNVVMFSYSPSENHVVFSSIFSPILERQYTFSNAVSLFRNSGLIQENDVDDFFKLLDRCREERGWASNTLRIYTTQGHYEWVDIYVHQAKMDNTDEHSVIFGTMINVSGWQGEVSRWKEKANRDALTDLYNREYFEQIAKQKMKTAKERGDAIVFIDVDDFKRINDTRGHVFGDSVLCSIAKRCLGVFRHTDIVARYGGDEFVVFVESISPEILEKRLQQLCEVFQYPQRADNDSEEGEYQFSCSIGAAISPRDGNDYHALLAHADCALYASKENGKGRYTMYDPRLEGCSPRQV